MGFPHDYKGHCSSCVFLFHWLYDNYLIIIDIHGLLVSSHCLTYPLYPTIHPFPHFHISIFPYPSGFPSPANTKVHTFKLLMTCPTSCSLTGSDSGRLVARRFLSPDRHVFACSSRPSSSNLGSVYKSNVDGPITTATAGPAVVEI